MNEKENHVVVYKFFVKRHLCDINLKESSVTVLISQ